MVATVTPGGVIDTGGSAFSGEAPKADSGRKILRYDPKDVALIFGAITILEGVAAGTFLMIDRAEDTWKTIVGCDGEVTRVKSNNQNANVEVSLRRGTYVNDILSGVMNSDEITGLVTAPLVLLDGNGRTVGVSPLAWIEKPAEVVYGADESVIVWRFKATQWNIYSGGFRTAASFQ